MRNRRSWILAGLVFLSACAGPPIDKTGLNPRQLATIESMERIGMNRATIRQYIEIEKGAK